MGVELAYFILSLRHAICRSLEGFTNAYVKGHFIAFEENSSLLSVENAPMLSPFQWNFAKYDMFYINHLFFYNELTFLF